MEVSGRGCSMHGRYSAIEATETSSAAQAPTSLELGLGLVIGGVMPYAETTLET